MTPDPTSTLPESAGQAGTVPAAPGQSGTAPDAPWPPNDPATRRTVPASSTPLDPARVESLAAVEWARFSAQHPASAAHHERAAAVLPLGETSSFQYWDPHPLAITAAQGACPTMSGTCCPP